MANEGGQSLPGPSDDDLKAAVYLGPNVKTTVKRSKAAAAAAAAATAPTLQRSVVNCLSCGKVFDCRQPAGDALRFLTAGGVCTFCGNRVRLSYTDGSTNEAATAEPAGEQTAAAAEASALRDRLVQYDRHSAKRTTVLDDQSDFFTIDANSWLTDEERAELKRREATLREAEEARRGKVAVTIDLLGRRVLMAGAEAEGSGAEAAHGAEVAAREATEAEAPQGGGSAARDAAAASVAEARAQRISVNPAMADAHYVFLPPPSGSNATRARAQKPARPPSSHPPRLQHDDPFELAAAELAQIMASMAGDGLT